MEFLSYKQVIEGEILGYEGLILPIRGLWTMGWPHPEEFIHSVDAWAAWSFLSRGLTT